MLHIDKLIVVEGKYDKKRVQNITDAPVICTHGFELYRSDAIINSIKVQGLKNGIIILTDSDSAGFRIRTYLKQKMEEKVEIYNAYIPEISGKEKRKDAPGKEGLIGVEGMSDEILINILKSFSKEKQIAIKPITKLDFYADGLTGSSDSSKKRKAVARLLNLPPKISANAMIDIINKTCGYDGYKKALNKMKKNKN